MTKVRKFKKIKKNNKSMTTTRRKVICKKNLFLSKRKNKIDVLKMRINDIRSANFFFFCLSLQFYTPSSKKNKTFLQKVHKMTNFQHNTINSQLDRQFKRGKKIEILKR